VIWLYSNRNRQCSLLSAEFFILNLSVSEILFCLSLICHLRYKFEIYLIVWTILTGLIMTSRPVSVSDLNGVFCYCLDGNFWDLCGSYYNLV